MARQESETNPARERLVELHPRQHLKSTITRLLERLAIIAPLVVTACTAPIEPQPLQGGGYLLQTRASGAGNGSSIWRDQNLGPDQNSLIDEIQFYWGRGGKIMLGLCFTGKKGEFRIISEQRNQTERTGPGFIYNKPHAKPGQRCAQYAPVIDVEKGEEDKISVGERRLGPFFGFPQEPCEMSYRVRSYLTKRVGGPDEIDQIEVTFLGIETLDPNSVVPRSTKEPAEYFQRSCLY